MHADAKVNSESLISISEAAELAGVHRSTIFRRLQGGALTKYQVPGDRRTFVLREEIAESTRARAVSLQDVQDALQGLLQAAQNAREAGIGSLLRRLREQRLMSSRSLAAASGLSPSAISRIEAGKLDPSLGALRQLGRALGVQPLVGFRTEDGDQIVAC